ncbi:MAG TPA: ATP-binding protein, partial [Pseudolabrys sp.]|nr:ATP-binding protein [Pseudolabrys sp.]
GLLDLERRDYKVRLGPPDVSELAVIASRFNTLAAALDSMRAENKTLNKRLIAAQDTERRQTARDLHDEVGPWLFALKANATSIAKLGDPAAAQGRAREMLGMIERLQLVNRGVLNRLRPMALGQIPLVDLLSTLVQERAREHPDVAISFAPQGLSATYGESIDLTVYRCVQESLTNIVRHAAAQRARLELAHVRNAPNAGDGRLVLTVTDDGCGMAPGTPKGRGLQGMQERVAALDGEFSTEAAPGGGTMLRIVIPLPDPMDS